MTPMRTSGELVGWSGETAAPVERRASLRLSRTQLLVVVACAIITAVVAAVVVSMQAPVYNTTRSVIVLSGGNPNDNDVLSRALESQIGRAHV